MGKHYPLLTLLLVLLPLAGVAQIQNQDDGLRLLREEFRLPAPAIPLCAAMPIGPIPNLGLWGRSPRPRASLSVVLAPIAHEHRGALRYFSGYQYRQLDCQLRDAPYVSHDPYLTTWIDPFRREESMRINALGGLLEGAGVALGHALGSLLFQ